MSDLPTSTLPNYGAVTGVQQDLIDQISDAVDDLNKMMKELRELGLEAHIEAIFTNNPANERRQSHIFARFYAPKKELLPSQRIIA